MLILPVILSCQKNKHLWQNIIKKIPNCIIFCGIPNLNKNFILKNNILLLKCNDFYEGLPEKIIAMIDSILQIEKFNEYTHIIKIDDHDTKIPENYFENIEKNFNIISNSDYCGQNVHNGKYVSRNWHFHKCSSNYRFRFTEYKGIFVPWIDGGCGYILSKNAMYKINSIYNFTNLNNVGLYHIYEDLMIAIILSKFNIYPIKTGKIIHGDK